MDIKREKNHIINCAAIACAAFGVSTAAFGDIVIDEFTDVGTPDPWPLNVSGTELTTAFETGLTDVLGGQRATLLRGIDNGGGGAESGLGIFASIDPSGSGVLDYTSSPDSDGALNLTYGGVPNPLDTDFSAEGGIVVEFAEMFDPLAGDGGGVMDLIVVVTLEDSDTSAEQTIAVQQPGAASLFFDFDQFTGLGELDLTNIDVVLVEFRASGGTQFRAERIFATIPGPSTLAILGIGLATTRRRRR